MRTLPTRVQILVLAPFLGFRALDVAEVLIGIGQV
jgi:hypothetical protein